MNDIFRSAIEDASAGHDLDGPRTASLVEAMLSGDADQDAVADLLLALRAKGECVDELVGAAEAMRRHMRRIEHRHDVLLDTCGTGGSRSGTFNISTAVAIVAAACGVAVAKHGNRAATSHSGSADVLEALGVAIESDASAVTQRLNDVGICFCFARKLHPAMAQVVAVRKRLGVQTLFNLLGPLCNPAGATHQLLGAASPEAQAKVAAAIGRLRTARSLVVHAEDGQDEVSLEGTTSAIDVRGGIGGRPVKSEALVWSAADFGLFPAGREALAAKDPAESASIIRRIFAGEPGPCRDVVLAGTAAALWLVGRTDDLRLGTTMAAEAIDDGAAMETLKKLR